MQPLVILDQHPRRLDELFSTGDLSRLRSQFTVIGGHDRPMSKEEIARHLPSAFAFVGAEPKLGHDELRNAPELRAVIEVLGTFPDTIDYALCERNGVLALSCAPGFRQAVAEMGLGMILSCARGIVTEQERFRTGSERWLYDDVEWDFTLYGQSIGFVGFGSIARELTKLLEPFSPSISAFDPWLADADAAPFDVRLASLEEVLTTNRCVIITASPTDQNRALIGADEIAAIPQGTSLVLLSRAHLVDFAAVTSAVRNNRIRFATDVFPVEPLAHDSPLRRLHNVILSPHRAAAVPGGRHLIGAMILEDLERIGAGKPARSLQRADPRTIRNRLGAYRQ